MVAGTLWGTRTARQELCRAGAGALWARGPRCSRLGDWWTLRSSHLPLSFIYLPALPTSTLTGRSHWDSELGATPIRSEEELCAPPLGHRHQKGLALWPLRGLAWMPWPASGKGEREAKEDSGAQGATAEHLERLGRSGLEFAPLGLPGLQTRPDSSLFTTPEPSQCHAFLARNCFQESRLWERIGACSERDFYSSQSAASQCVDFPAIGPLKEWPPYILPHFLANSPRLQV